MKKDLTRGSITAALCSFAAPMILGNLLQQAYNLADTLVVGRCLGDNALAAVGSTYTLTTFIYSIIIGLCMGAGSLVSYYGGKKDPRKLADVISLSLLLIGVIAVIIELAALVFQPQILRLLKTPTEIMSLTSDYVRIILIGICFIFLYNYYSFMLRGLGDSVTPLVFLGISSAVNILLDILFVAKFSMGIKGAAWATLISQALAGAGSAVFSLVRESSLRPQFSRRLLSRSLFSEVARMSSAACVQQSVMNFGILMIQGLVNSFGTSVMAAFTVAVKIDTLAYMPAQEFGSAFSLFISQNFGAREGGRIRRCVKSSMALTAGFCAAISIAVNIFAAQLMQIFAKGGEVVQIGVRYLRIEGAFYVGIGVLFLLYGYFRGVNRPEMSLLLTVISLGTRVALAYAISPAFGVVGIWWSIPIGWFLADIVGAAIMRRSLKTLGDT